jgi:hypothetical protein
MYLSTKEECNPLSPSQVKRSIIVTPSRPVRLVYQPPANSTFLSEQTSHQQPASGTFLSEQISTSHQPPAKRTCCIYPNPDYAPCGYTLHSVFHPLYFLQLSQAVRNSTVLAVCGLWPFLSRKKPCQQRTRAPDRRHRADRGEVQSGDRRTLAVVHIRVAVSSLLVTATDNGTQ